MKLAIYFEKENEKWVTLEDSCPHRRAPLSQGRLLTGRDPATGEIKDTKLECSYHGWTFEGARGNCSRIPQLSGCSSLVSPGVAAAATASPRACATPRPCKVAQGMLWVWGEGPRAAVGKMGRRSSSVPGRHSLSSSDGSGSAGEAAEGAGQPLEEGEEDPVARMFRESEETEPIYAPGIAVDDPNLPSDADPANPAERLLTLAGRYYRDVEYDATTLIDNLMDASHLAFGHNRVLGDRDAHDAGDVAAARVSLRGSEGGGEEEVESAALAAVLSSTEHRREKWERESEKPEGEHRHLDRHSAAARALRADLLTGDAAVFDAAFRVPRTDAHGRMLTRIVFEPPALATWFCDKPDGDPVCAGSRWRVRSFYLLLLVLLRSAFLFFLLTLFGNGEKKKKTFFVNSRCPSSSPRPSQDAAASSSRSATLTLRMSTSSSSSC